LPVEPDAPPADGAAALSVVTGLMPLPVQPQAATDAKLDQSLTSTTQQNPGVAIAGANAEHAAPRGLLAMLERQAGATSAADKGDAAAFRTFAATSNSSIDATSLMSAMTPVSTAREVATTTTTSTQAVADTLPATPSAASATLLAAPSDSARTQVAVAHVEQPVGTDAWKDQVGHQVTWMVQHQVGRAELRLHPAHLGPIEVSVSVNNDEVNVSFQASHPATREALENSLPRLRELLGHSGLSLGQASVSQQFAGGERTPERAQAPDNDGGSRFDERSAQIEAPITTRVRVGLLDAYA
jgi:flagellar hook-length control protein FliK